MASNDKAENIKNISLIPLRDLVIFPSTLVPFIIGRSSSIDALDKANELLICQRIAHRKEIYRVFP